MKKLSNTEAQLKKSAAYKKSVQIHVGWEAARSMSFLY